ncbi:hypothetical protein JCM21900_002800 [Sporobolomyces salmonicolor]
METLNERAGFLCNHEVLQILRRQRDDRAARIKVLDEQRRKSRNEGTLDSLMADEKERVQPQDLHTVTFEAIRYLEDDVHPIRRQTPKSVANLLDKLEDLDLTKAERLHIVNLAPTSLVELHVCIEELGERFSEPQQLELVQMVKDHLGKLDQATTRDGDAALEDRMDEDRDELDEREAAALHEEDELIDEGLGGGGAQEDAVNDIDEVEES